MSYSPWRVCALACLAALAAGLLMFSALPAKSAAPCLTHAMQVEGLEASLPEFGNYLNRIVAKDGEPGTFVSITIRAKMPNEAYIATFEYGCYAGQFIVIPADQVKALFSPVEWGSLASQDM